MLPVVWDAAAGFDAAADGVALSAQRRPSLSMLTGRAKMLASVAATLVYAAAGVAAFKALGLPIPWLLGPMFAGLIAALVRAPLAAPPRVGDAMRTVLGVAVGASITPELLGRLPEMAYSVALVPVMVLVVGLVGVPCLLGFPIFCGSASSTGRRPIIAPCRAGCRTCWCWARRRGAIRGR